MRVARGKFATVDPTLKQLLIGSPKSMHDLIGERAGGQGHEHLDGLLGHAFIEFK